MSESVHTNPSLYSKGTELCFQGVVSRIGGASFDDFQQDLLNLSKRAWLARKPLAQGEIGRASCRERV